RALRDTRIGRFAVPKGSEVVVWLYHTHHDPRFFPEPECYRPERFADHESATRPKHAYLPFGAGQRACIGQLFALIEGQLVLATLLQRVELHYAATRAPGMRLGVTLAPKNRVPMRIRARAST